MLMGKQSRRVCYNIEVSVIEWCPLSGVPLNIHIIVYTEAIDHVPRALGRANSTHVYTTHRILVSVLYLADSSTYHHGST